MKKILTALATLLLISTLGTEARRISPDEALARAFNAPAAAPGMKKSRGKQFVPLVSQAADSLSNMYIFNAVGAQGYLIAPADDEFPTVIGYSDQGTVNFSDMPPAMKYMLGQYQAEMAYALEQREAGATGSARAVSTRSMSPIEPMVKTVWNQDAPFNALCPYFKYTNGRSEQCVTGCAATAMAQVINYHKYPAHGTGYHSYECNISGVGKQTLSFDYENTYFDWDNMIDDYNGSYTDAQAQAVATLMYACGVSLDMGYGPSSGASSQDVDKAIIDYFGYSTDLRHYQRDYCSSVEWEEYIYESLAGGCPVFYHGHSSEGGHAFVVDGYDGDHLFHINWGWGGISDGFFLLSRLNPTEQGIGSFEGGYNQMQGAICNIKPAGPADGPLQEGFIGCDGDFSYGSFVASGYQFEDYFFANTSSGASGMFLYGPENMEASLGIELFDGSATTYYYDGMRTFRPNGGVYGFKIYSTIPDGTYTVRPVYQTQDGTVHRMKVLNGCRDRLKITVSNGQIRSSSTEPAYDATTIPQLIGNVVAPDGSVYSGQTASFLFQVTNLSATTDYYGKIKYLIKDTSGAQKGWFELDYAIPAATTIPNSVNLDLQLEPGTYTMSACDCLGNEISPDYQFTVEQGETFSGKYKIVGISPSTFEGSTEEKFNLLVDFDYSPSYSTYFSYRLEFKDKDGKLVKNVETGTAWGLAGSGICRLETEADLSFGKGEYFVTGYTIEYDPNTWAMNEYKSSNPMRVLIGKSPSAVSLSTKSLQVVKGRTATLSATVSPADAEFKNLWWYSTDKAVATVDNGTVKGEKLGKAQVVVITQGGMFDICDVEVVDGPAVIEPESVALSSSKLSMKLGESAQLTATVAPAEAAQDVEWASSDETVATVDAEGNVKALKVGSAVITATAKGTELKAECAVTVVAPEPESVALSASALSLKLGESAQLTATVAPAEAAQDVEWTSSDEAVATVDAEGNVKALKVGSAVITATAKGTELKAECAISVDYPDVASVTLDNSEITVIVGKTFQLLATVLPETARQDLYWKTSDASVATVDDNGLVEALAQGTTIISAVSYNGIIAECKVNVSPASGIASLLVDGKPVVITVQNGQLSADLPAGTEMTVVNLAGAVLYRGQGHDIPALDKGVYIILCQGQALKIILD